MVFSLSLRALKFFLIEAKVRMEEICSQRGEEMHVEKGEEENNTERTLTENEMWKSCQCSVYNMTIP